MKPRVPWTTLKALFLSALLAGSGALGLSGAAAQDDRTGVWVFYPRGEPRLSLKNRAGGSLQVRCSGKADKDRIYLDFTLPRDAGNADFQSYLDAQDGLAKSWGWYEEKNGVRQGDDLSPYRGKITVAYANGDSDTIQAENYIETHSAITVEGLTVPSRFQFEASSLYAYPSEGHRGFSIQMDAYLQEFTVSVVSVTLTVSDNQQAMLNWRYTVEPERQTPDETLSNVAKFLDTCPVTPSAGFGGALDLLR